MRSRSRLFRGLGGAFLLLVLLFGALRTFSLWSMGRIGFYPGEWIEVPANPARGFHVPYRLYVPPSRNTPRRLWLRPNNTGVGASDDPDVHHEDAANLLAVSRWQADWLNAVVLVPSFQRPTGLLYTHALDADSLTASPPNGRPDLQLLAMAEDATRRFRSQGKEVCDKVFIDGFSASGMFASRFVGIHPSRVAAAAIGAPGGWPFVPAASDSGLSLPYPAGTADFAERFGGPVDRDSWSRVPLFFYLGDQDTNDSLPYADSYDPALGRALSAAFGPTPVERWDDAERLYDGMNSTFRLYPGVGHGQTTQVLSDVLEFFREADDRSGCQ